jgi:hypothetical protein
VRVFVGFVYDDRTDVRCMRPEDNGCIVKGQPIPLLDWNPEEPALSYLYRYMMRGAIML